MAIFRIKFVYKTNDPDTGDVEKVKTEVLAQCINYTDAEALAVKLIDMENMCKFEPADYEIVKQKFSHANMELTDEVMGYDNNTLINGLVEHFFEDEDSHIYFVKVTVPVEDLDSGKTKNEKHEAYVSAKSAGDALSYFSRILMDAGSKYIVKKQVRMDEASAIYLTPETHAQVFNRQIKA